MLRVSQVAALAFVFVLPSPASAQDYFGAIAYSWQTGAHGWANVYPSREAAEQTALSICSQHAKDCRPVLWFRNACGALALGPKVGAGWDWAEDQAVADRRAINACATQSKACTVKQRVCTTR